MLNVLEDEICQDTGTVHAGCHKLGLRGVSVTSQWKLGTDRQLQHSQAGEPAQPAYKFVWL